MSDQFQPPSPPVVPNIWVDNVEALRSFYIDQLGFAHMMGVVGKDGKLDFCIVMRESALIMLGRPEDRIEGSALQYPTRRPLEIYIYLKDIDAYHAEVKTRGVAIASPLTTQWWGDRNFSVVDPYGYTLWLGETVGEMTPPPGMKVI